MRKLSFILLCSLILLSRCYDEDTELERFPMGEIELNMAPYKQGDTFQFVHSNGLNFNIYVDNIEMKWERYDVEEKRYGGGTYNSHEQRTITLNAAYPSLSIKINNQAFTDYYFYNSLHFNINGSNGMINYDSLGQFLPSANYTFHDSLLVEKIWHYKVAEILLFGASSTDTLVNHFTSFLYNKKDGIIQIKTSNNETYTLQ